MSFLCMGTYFPKQLHFKTSKYRSVVTDRVCCLRHLSHLLPGLLLIILLHLCQSLFQLTATSEHWNNGATRTMQSPWWTQAAALDVLHGCCCHSLSHPECSVRGLLPTTPQSLNHPQLHPLVAVAAVVEQLLQLFAGASCQPALG